MRKYGLLIAMAAVTLLLGGMFIYTINASPLPSSPQTYQPASAQKPPHDPTATPFMPVSDQGVAIQVQETLEITSLASETSQAVTSSEQPTITPSMAPVTNTVPPSPEPVTETAVLSPAVTEMTATPSLAPPTPTATFAPRLLGPTSGPQKEKLPGTPTPFQPLPQTSTPTATPLPTQTMTPTQTATPKPEEPTIPPPIPWDDGIEIPEGQFSILLLGSDMRPGGGFRTDVMALAILNPQEGTISVVSFPRDLYVFIPGWGMNRLNTAMQIGGFETMAATFQYNFGVRPDRYMLTNFEGFTSIVDSVGGVTINVEKSFSDKCDLAWGKNGVCSLDPGPIVMDGASALWYVRGRYSTSDFDRNRRQQEVLQAIFRRMMHIDAIFNAPEYYEYYRENVETNLSLEDLLPLMKAAPAFANPDHIRRFTIGPGQVYDFIAEGGAMVLVPYPNAVQGIIQQALQP